MARQIRPLEAIKFIVVHHSASNDAYSTHETLDRHIKATNLGYHISVDDDAVFKSKDAGRDGKFTFKQHVPDTEVVWGAAGCNYNGWHIAFDGNTLNDLPTEDEKHAMVQIIAAKCKAWGWHKSDVSRIVSHRYVGQYVSAKKYVTECPGDGVISWLPELRRAVAEYLPE